MRPRLLDLCCGAGGASMGYHMAGFDVVGVDIDPQPNYPFEFHQADALKFSVDGFDAIHVSPPCQGYSRLRHRQESDYPLLIPDFRYKLQESSVPYVIENVEDAGPYMEAPIRLCGSSFGLRIRRHRLFETSICMPVPGCSHEWQELHKPYQIYVGKSRLGGVGYRQSGVQPVYGGNHNVGGKSLFMKSVAMGIDWMAEDEINEAIPPAYTSHLGKSLITHV